MMETSPNNFNCGQFNRSMSLQEHRIPYFIVGTEQDHRGRRIQASYHKHHLLLNYGRRETPDGLLWFGSLVIDGVQFWATPAQIGCQTISILDAEMQHQLYTWAMRLGYTSTETKQPVRMSKH